MSYISSKRVLQQLKADLIGKDSYRGITLTYAWLANQFGHFSLGFIPTFVLYYLIQDKPQFKNPLWSSFIISVAWLLFELYNFLGPLLLKKRNILKPKYLFKPEWKNIAFDTFTDLCFFWLGAFTFSLLIEKSLLVILVLLVLIFILLPASRHWFLTKMYQMYANYPFQMRLSQWNFKLLPEDIERVKTFLKQKDEHRHLLIFGPQKSGKTSLGVAIANENSIKHQPCLYTSAIKLYASFFKETEETNSYTIWNWKKARFLVIDDINPGDPIPEDLVDAPQFLRFIDVFSNENHQINRTNLKNKNVIWILGDKKENTLFHQNSWINLVKTLGVSDDKITVINLLK